MLLKGYDEVRNSPRPHAAADMVLVRLAYAADLPMPADLMRQLRDGSAVPAGKAGAAAPSQAASRKPVHARAPETAVAETGAPDDSVDIEAEATEPSPLAAPASFEEVVALAGDKRDLKLKHALTEQVRLVRFRPGHIELNPLPAAPKELGQDLMRKLKEWTGRVWIVALSGEPGAEPLGVERRAREAREIDALREHPQVKEVLARFPDARIAAVRSMPKQEPQSGAPQTDDELRDDGTDP
jgi:DNA polymerase-3 subunit gamma/tau